MMRKGLAVAVILLFIGTGIIPSVVSKTVEKPSLPISTNDLCLLYILPKLQFKKDVLN